MNKRKNIKGQRFGRLVVLDFDSTRKRKAYWKCLCDCGIEKVIRGDGLRSGSTKSCGCYNREIVSEIMKGRIGKNHPLFGKTQSAEVCQKISIANSGENNPMFGIHRFGEDNPNYKHGLSGTKGYLNAKNQKRNTKKLNQTPPDADINTIQEIYRLCAELNDSLGQGSFHVDHIMPLDKGGLHHQDNLQIIPAHENRVKYNKDPRDYYGRHYDFMTGGK